MTLKFIEGYEGLYKISDDGRVFSIDRFNIDKNGKKKFYPGKELKYEIGKHSVPYKRVTLCKDNKTKKYLIHRLVAESFIENPDNKPNVNHIDNDSMNNNVNNLEWCTHNENMAHAQKQGRLFNSQSKAGKIAGKILKKRSMDRIKSLYGKTFGNWKIVSFDRRKNDHAYVIAECQLCGKEHSVSLTSITKGRSKNCRSCGLRKKI